MLSANLQVGKFDGNVLQGLSLEIVIVAVVTLRLQREWRRGHEDSEVVGLVNF